MHLHILGICGTFMGGIAAIARQAGHQVTGCDANVYPPMSTQLEASGISLIEGFAADQLSLKPDLFVIGNVVSRGNPLMEAILNAGLPYVSGPQWLGEQILQHHHVLSVAGTHGKTTTTAMLTWILEASGLSPSYLIGGVPNNFDVSARIGQSKSPRPLFVIEADEYDTAFFDKRSKFVHYRSSTAILNNLEFDHADIFADLAAIQTQFHHLVRTVPAQGRLIVNGDESALQEVMQKGAWSPIEYFGNQGHDSTWSFEGLENDNFIVKKLGEPVAKVEWDILANVAGRHNQMNALAAIAAAQHVGVSPEASAKALENFKNVKRRLELVGKVNDIAVYDDFAHHPTAIATTIDGLRRRIGSQRLIAVLEPRSNTMKLGVMKKQLPDSLVQADLVFAYGAKEGKSALGWDLQEAMMPMGQKAKAFDQLDTLVNAIQAIAQPGDHILVMSNGGFGGVHQQLLKALA
ncbi:MAG: UDP-N-acetylmuramate:L-alanyl-gamma-D-glutamyl-meso-diaminopimelate ligase [Betaproteobacteria bacterium]